jgi:hypothetical protein
MVVQSHQAVSRGAAVVVAVGLMLIATGCTTLSQNQPETGLPRNLEVVGGGLTINWIAPTAGTAYLVEKTSGKIIETRAMNEGDVFKFEVDPDQPTVFERSIGVNLNNARIVLLFKPAKSQRRTR